MNKITYHWLGCLLLLLGAILATGCSNGAYIAEPAQVELTIPNHAELSLRLDSSVKELSKRVSYIVEETDTLTGLHSLKRYSALSGDSLGLACKVKIVVNPPDLDNLIITSLALKANDGSYYYSIQYPALHEEFNHVPLMLTNPQHRQGIPESNRNEDNIFYVSKEKLDYTLELAGRVYDMPGNFDPFVLTTPLVIKPNQ